MNLTSSKYELANAAVAKSDAQGKPPAYLRIRSL